MADYADKASALLFWRKTVAMLVSFAASTTTSAMSIAL
jgi:hypothetical protein